MKRLCNHTLVKQTRQTFQTLLYPERRLSTVFISNHRRKDESTFLCASRVTMDRSREPSQTEYITRQKYSTKITEKKEKFLHMPIEEKRKVYQCKNKYNTLDHVPTWEQYFVKNQDSLKRKTAKKSNLGKGLEDKRKVRPDLNKKVSLWRGDITTLEIDAIVNAANESLLGGGGVDGAIHRAAGKKLVEECATLRGCKTGKAKITGGYKLPAKYVIHTVGPIGEQKDQLKSAYINCLELVKENNLVSVAFPCISTGIYGYSSEKAAPVAIQCVRNWLEKDDISKNVERVIFCLFLPKDVDIYEELMQHFFPIDPESIDRIEKESKAEDDKIVTVTKEKSEPEDIVKNKKIKKEFRADVIKEGAVGESVVENKSTEDVQVKPENQNTSIEKSPNESAMDINSATKSLDKKEVEINVKSEEMEDISDNQLLDEMEVSCEKDKDIADRIEKESKAEDDKIVTVTNRIEKESKAEDDKIVTVTKEKSEAEDIVKNKKIKKEYRADVIKEGAVGGSEVENKSTEDVQVKPENQNTSIEKSPNESAMDIDSATKSLDQKEVEINVKSEEMEDISDNQLLDEMEVSCEKDKDIAGKEAMHTLKSNEGENGSKPITRNELKETIKKRSDR